MTLFSVTDDAFSRQHSLSPFRYSAYEFCAHASAAAQRRARFSRFADAAATAAERFRMPFSSRCAAASAAFRFLRFAVSPLFFAYCRFDFCHYSRFFFAATIYAITRFFFHYFSAAFSRRFTPFCSCRALPFRLFFAPLLISLFSFSC